MTNKEQEFIRLLLLQDKEIKQIFAETINALAGDLNHFTAVERAITPENIWLKNKRIEQRIEQKLLSFQSQFTSTLSTARAEALGISKKYGDEIINSYISNLPISGVAKEGIFLRSLEGFTAFQNKGLDIKESVWKTTQGLKDQIAFYGGSGVASGQASKRISTDLKNYLQHPDKRFRRIRDPKTGKLKLSQPAKNFHPGTGTYRSSYQNALRLAQTETNMAFRHADQMRWKEMAFVNGYEVKLSNAHPELDICDSMAGRYPKNFLFGGWHPKCICFIVPMMSPKKDFINYLKTGNLNQSQVINTIPGQAANYVNKMAPAYRRYKSKPYFLKDNFTLKGGEFVLKQSAVKVANMAPEVIVTKPSFTPAKTLKEAENRLMSNGFEQVYLNNASIEQANGALEWIEYENKIKPIKITRFSFTNKLSDQTVAAYYETNAVEFNELRINSNLFGKKNRFVEVKSYSQRLDKLKRAYESNKESIKFYKSKLGVSKSRDRMYRADIRKIETRQWGIESEISKLEKHIKAGDSPLPSTYASGYKDVESQMRVTVHHELGHYRDEIAKATSERKYIALDNKAVSEYSMSSSNEYFAEMYAKWRMEGDKNIPEDLLKIFKSL